MYIEPNSDIVILRNVPLDPTYDHTIYWNPTSGAGGATAQRDYFLSKRKGYNPLLPEVHGEYWLSAQSYQRVKRGYIRCELLADRLYDCNYLMFQNTSFGSKWFYAFIRNVEYINNKVCEIQFELDVMQTWHFDYQLEDCFVEREHTTTDEIGDNTIPENLEIGDYLYLDGGKTFQNNHGESDFSICICALWSRQPDGIIPGKWSNPDDAEAGFYNGVYSGLHYTVIPLNQTDIQLGVALDGILGDLSEQRKEEIVGIYMIPSTIISEKSETPNQNAGGKLITRSKHYSWSGGDQTKYEPINKKLYTYPYNAIYITSSDGDSAYFKYELFKGENCNFVLEGAMGVPPEIGLTPSDYAADPVSSTPISFTVTTVDNSAILGTVSYLIDYSGSAENLVGMKFCVNNGSKIVTVTEGYTLTGEVTTKRIYIANDKYSYDTSENILHLDDVLTAIPKPNYNFTISVKNFPMCSWVTDTFKAWLAQNGVRLIAGVATTVAGALATGGVIGATAGASPWMTQSIADARQMSNAISAGSGVANSLIQTIPAMLQPDHAHGVNKGMLGMANGEFGYHFYYARIKDEFARIIDDYFTRYGYAIKRNKIPNRTARPYWTYTKTIGCTIKASFPTSDAKTICDIYNNGITFWKISKVNNVWVDNVIGDYSLNNRPASSQQTATPSTQQTVTP